MTREQAIAAARQFCESPAGLVLVREEDSWFLAAGEPGLPSYGLPAPPYWVIPLQLSGPKMIGSSSVVVVSEHSPPRIVRYGE